MRGRRTGRVLACLLAMLLWAGQMLPATAAPDGATVWGYSEGMAQCELDGKWGFVDAGRNVVIPLQYDSVVSFQLGIAAVNLNGKLGVIRPDGRYLIQPEYDTLLPVDCGLYIAQKGAGWGVVSILPVPDGAGGSSNVLYDLTYDSARVDEQGGTQVLTLVREGTTTKIPVYDLPGILAQRGVASVQFPLTRGKQMEFSDVSPRAWYALWVDIAYNVGLTSGVGNNRFAPEQILTVAEALKLAATVESRYRGDTFHQESVSGPNWYVPAVDYCLASGIIQSGTFGQADYNRPVTRREAAELFAATSLAKAMPEINSLARVRTSVPDVAADDPGAEAVYSLYARGILSGVDGNLTFRPEGTFTRAEAAAIVSRMARTEQRLLLWT